MKKISDALQWRQHNNTHKRAQQRTQKIAELIKIKYPIILIRVKIHRTYRRSPYTQHARWCPLLCSIRFLHRSLMLLFSFFSFLFKLMLMVGERKKASTATRTQENIIKVYIMRCYLVCCAHQKKNILFIHF